VQKEIEMDKDTMQAITKLITGEKFRKLAAMENRVNIFEVTDLGSREIKHSATIKWFLDPSGSHNLKDLFFKRLVSRLFENNRDRFDDEGRIGGIDIINDILLADFTNAKVSTEVKASEGKKGNKKTDILFDSKDAKKIVLCIENKVWAGVVMHQDDTQLDTYHNYITGAEEYKDYKHLFVFLTPDGHAVPDITKTKAWLPLSYEHIREILDEIKDMEITNKVKIIIDDYIELLGRENIINNKELQEVLAAVYGDGEENKKALEYLKKKKNENDTEDETYKNLMNKYKAVFDLLLQYDKEHNINAEIVKIYTKILADKNKEGRIIYDSDGKNNFDKLSWNTERMNAFFGKNKESKGGSWGTGRKYNYWIDLSKNCIHLELGPLDQDVKTIDQMNRLIDRQARIKPVGATDQYRRVKKWELYGIDHTYISGETEENSADSKPKQILDPSGKIHENIKNDIKAKLTKALEDIDAWEKDTL
jgi:hypothetical protein